MSSVETVLVTGGAGYIGSHAAVALCHAGFRAVLLDNLANGRPSTFAAVAALCPGAVECEIADILDVQAVARALRRHRVDAVLHFAGLKAVAESFAQPDAYWRTNVSGTASLVAAMEQEGVRRLVFSSSAAVYGEHSDQPLAEEDAPAPLSPYGATKLFAERLLADVARRSPAWRIAALRYFNPVGAHQSGLLGDQGLEPPTNLMPLVMRAAARAGETVLVYGNDYPTPDGTAIRDYVHVMDVADSHVAALRVLDDGPPFLVVNVGTGRGHSVLDLLRAAVSTTGKTIPFEVVDRRPGDIAVAFADVSRAAQVLGWRAQRTLAEMCRDHWYWQQQHREAGLLTLPRPV